MSVETRSVPTKEVASERVPVFLWLGLVFTLGVASVMAQAVRNVISPELSALFAWVVSTAAGTAVGALAGLGFLIYFGVPATRKEK